MEILFVFLIGATIGMLARYSLPRRERYGALLVPALAAAVASALWTVLTWAGLDWSAGLIWWLSLGLSAVVATVVALRLGRTRTVRDEHRLRELAGSTAEVL